MAWSRTNKGNPLESARQMPFLLKLVHTKQFWYLVKIKLVDVKMIWLREIKVKLGQRLGSNGILFSPIGRALDFNLQNSTEAWEDNKQT